MMTLIIVISLAVLLIFPFATILSLITHTELATLGALWISIGQNFIMIPLIFVYLGIA